MPAEITCILPEDRQPGKGIIAFKQRVQTIDSGVIKPLRQDTSQPLPFIRKRPAYQLLERGIAGRMILCALSKMSNPAATKPGVTSR